MSEVKQQVISRECCSSARVDQIRGAVSRLANAAILESSPGYGALSRFSIYADQPRAIFQAMGSDWQLTGDWPGRKPSSRCPLDAIRELLCVEPEVPARWPFFGGWIGYFGYDVALLLESLPRQHPRSSSLPDIHLAYYDTFAIHDLTTGTMEIVATNRFGEPASEVEERTERLQRLIAEFQPEEDDGRPLVEHAPASDFTPDEYCWAVERILEYLRAGDIFQANFTHRFSAPFRGNVPTLYERCRRRTPAPFSALLRHPQWNVVSTSPERFLKVTPGGQVETRPIKGTRARGSDPIHDLLLREELLSSAKDHAELTMIVDLERNDLGRVCEFGSVKVTHHAQVESYSNVHHLVSCVEGKLRPGCDVMDLLRSAFPGGSITGAPKIRAMQIIDELERCRRGVYTGAIGYFSDNGHADWNIAIRTMVLEDDTVHYHVGGGIVVDSDPLAEYRESLIKGRKLREVLLGELAAISHE